MSFSPSSNTNRQPQPTRAPFSHSHQSRHLATPLSLPSFRRRHNSNSSSIISSMNRPLSTLPPRFATGSDNEEEGIMLRDHTVVGFEWPIQNIDKLKDHIEGQAAGLWSLDAEMSDPEALPEALSRGVVIGEGFYKLDVARTLPPGCSPKSTVSQMAETANTEQYDASTLSLYIASLILDGQPARYSCDTSIFVGIKPTISNAGLRYATPNWLWTHSCNWEFSRDKDFVEIELPRLSALLEHKEIKGTNDFILSVQISTAASQPVALPDRVIVPQSVINGLKSLIDSPTGDVKFVCLEHSSVPAAEEEDNKGEIMSRKRTIYAHSDILKSRGQYFMDLLTGGFSESEARRGDNKVTSIIVDDADFETVYWVVRFLYTNQLVFSDTEDVRALMDQVNIDKSEINKLLAGNITYRLGSPGEWEYRTLPPEGEAIEEEFETRTVKSVSSTGTSASRRIPSGITSPPPATKPQVSARERPTSGASIISKTRITSKTPAKVSSTTSSSATPTPKSASKTTQPARSVKSPNASPAVPRTQYTLPIARHHPEPDPHGHPAPEKQPASALSVYMLSHRYRLEDLENLAKDHILGMITAENCMTMLLATHQYEDLHAEILNFMAHNWTEVQSEAEFFKCIQEVSAGIWGEAGGLVLHRLFQRL